MYDLIVINKKGVMGHMALLIGRARLQIGAEKYPDRWLPYGRGYHVVRTNAIGPPETMLFKELKPFFLSTFLCKIFNHFFH